MSNQKYYKNYNHGFGSNLTLRGNIVRSNLSVKEGKILPSGFVTLALDSMTNNGKVTDFILLKVGGYDAKRIMEQTNNGDRLDIVGKLRSGLDREQKTFMFVEPSEVEITLRNHKSIDAMKANRGVQQPQQPVPPQMDKPQQEPQQEPQSTPHDAPMDFDDDIPF